MPKPCSICARPDAPHLLERAKQGESARSIAASVGVGSRMLLKHLAHLPGNPLARARAGAKGRAVRDAKAEVWDTLAELRALLVQVKAIIADATAEGSQKLGLEGIREARATLETIARVSGELSNAPQVQVTLVQEASALSAHDVYLRALRVVELWRLAHPEELAVEASVALESEGTSPTPGGSLESRSSASVVR